ncbi:MULTISPECIES: RNA polymerase sigma factor [unclassified Corynebacterium]|uniref:RNA polymerase sigma factor n=1 Tax=unclassified Corynebacterium TaxID=2624378 RepID=UPI002648BF9A|nr:RNA polymerase sigma factor [Corynebacterium sp.]MDN5719189.1 RNA polymerase sigma factor [Corynebacterium sp.]MDN6324296.1 RNA polymerase sigma factor [Corynebacterium sp.]MDN6509099.1 RNA polymerase sigma factor [Corynebacterium sp.]
MTTSTAPEITPETAPSDAELLRRHLAGCSTSFTDLLARHSGLLGWALHQAGVPLEDRPDVLQDGLLKVHRTAGSFRGKDSAASWLHTIMRNTALTHLRDSRRRTDELARSVDLGERLRTLPDNRNVDAARTIHRILLGEAVSQLHPGLRDVIVLTDVRDWSLSETAAHLGIPTGTVKSRRARAHRHLRERLAEAGVAPAVSGASLESSA